MKWKSLAPRLIHIGFRMCYTLNWKQKTSEDSKESNAFVKVWGPFLKYIKNAMIFQPNKVSCGNVSFSFSCFVLMSRGTTSMCC